MSKHNPLAPNHKINLPRKSPALELTLDVQPDEPGTLRELAAQLPPLPIEDQETPDEAPQDPQVNALFPWLRASELPEPVALCLTQTELNKFIQMRLDLVAKVEQLEAKARAREQKEQAEANLLEEAIKKLATEGAPSISEVCEALSEIVTELRGAQ